MKSIRMMIAAIVSLLVLAPAFAGGGHEQGALAKPGNLKDFTRIEVGSGIRVELSQGTDFSVEATGDRDALSKLEMRVEGSVLRLGFRPFSFVTGSVTVAIRMPVLQGLDASGGSRVRIDFDASKTAALNIELSGGSRLEGTLIGSGIALDISGGSQAAFGGYANDCTIDASGGSRFDCFDFAVDQARLEISGGSYVAIAVQTGITVNASGGSRLEYRGNPSVQQDVSGAAMVKKSDRK